MNLRKKIVNTVAAAAMLVGMTGGVVSAIDIDTDTPTAQLNVSCPAITNVSAVFGPAFTINLVSGPGAYTSSTSTVAITVDLTCNNQAAWGGGGACVGTSVATTGGSVGASGVCAHAVEANGSNNTSKMVSLNVTLSRTLKGGIIPQLLIRGTKPGFSRWANAPARIAPGT